jgi:hypothetical protein
LPRSKDFDASPVISLGSFSSSNGVSASPKPLRPSPRQLQRLALEQRVRFLLERHTYSIVDGWQQI